MNLVDKLALKCTGIGSMPHKDVARAIDIIAVNCPDIFVWPQLPNISKFEDMMLQYSEGFPGLTYDEADNRYFIDSSSDSFFESLEKLMLDYEEIVEGGNLENLDDYAITSEYSRAIPPWLEKAASLKSSALKGQITGPFTFATSYTDADKKCILYDETLKETTEKFLTLKAIWQLEQFKKYSPESVYIISLDEPSMSQYGSSAFLSVSKADIVNSLNAVAEVIHKFGGISFSHCCGNTDWTIITSSKVQILNFDAYNFSESLTLYPDDLNLFFDRGGIIAWGLIPTLDPEQIEKVTFDDVIKIYDTTVSKLVDKGIDKQTILNQSIITPSCGTGSISESQAEKALKLTYEVSCFLRSKNLNNYDYNHCSFR